MQDLADSLRELRRKGFLKGETLRNVGDVNTAKVDNEFGENKALTRHGGRIGTKQMRKMMATDTKHEEMDDYVTVMRKTASRPRSVV